MVVEGQQRNIRGRIDRWVPWRFRAFDRPCPSTVFIRYTIPREMSSIIPAALVDLQNGLGKAPADFSCFHPPFPQTVPRQVAGTAVDKDSRTRGIAA